MAKLETISVWPIERDLELRYHAQYDNAHMPGGGDNYDFEITPFAIKIIDCSQDFSLTDSNGAFMDISDFSIQPGAENPNESTDATTGQYNYIIPSEHQTKVFTLPSCTSLSECGGCEYELEIFLSGEPGVLNTVEFLNIFILSGTTLTVNLGQDTNEGTYVVQFFIKNERYR